MHPPANRPAGLNASLRIRVLLYPGTGCWVAQGIEKDVTAEGTNPEDVVARFLHSLADEAVIGATFGDPDLDRIEPAPATAQKRWRMGKMAPLASILPKPSLVPTWVREHVHELRIHR